MFNGAHLILYSSDADADRAFIRDVLEFPHVDAGRGWLIFALPPTEVAVHPTEGAPPTALYLLCQDVHAAVRRLSERGVASEPITEAPWGSVTGVTLPSGGKIGVYQPKHPLAITLAQR